MDKGKEFIKNEILITENRLFIGKIITIVISYVGITLWLNAIRATTSVWFLWTLIIIQFTLYFSIFVSCYRRSKVCGLNKNIGIFIFGILTFLGRVEDWELLIIPLLVIIMIIFSIRNKNVSKERQYILNDK